MSYFKPLRRKIGAMTLAMACVFAAGWVRNIVCFDVAWIPIGNNVSGVIFSGNQKLVYFVERYPSNSGLQNKFEWTAVSNSQKKRSLLHYINGNDEGRTRY